MNLAWFSNVCPWGKISLIWTSERWSGAEEFQKKKWMQKGLLWN